MSSDSSSEDENLEYLKEAISTDFFTNKFYYKDKSTPQEEDTPSVPKPKSLRKVKNHNEQFDNLGVTEDFQKYVSKNLEKSLDKLLDNSLDFSQQEYLSKKRKNKGIKMFSNSEVLVKKPKKEEFIPPKTKPKLEILSKEQEKLLLEKAKSVAVDSKYIISKKEIKNWSTRTKAPVFYYENHNGVLCEKIKDFV